MACRGEVSSSILADAELKVQHTLSATVCQHGPKGPGEGHRPLELSEIFLQKSPSQITGSQSPLQLAQGRVSVWPGAGVVPWGCSRGYILQEASATVSV